MRILPKPLTATTFTLLFALFLSPSLTAQTPKTLPGAKVELRVLTMPDEVFAKYTLDNPSTAEKGVPIRTAQFFNSDERSKLLERLQGLKGVNLMQAPNITVGSTRKANVSCGQTVNFVTGYEETKVKEQTIKVPKNEAIIEGLQATVCPSVSADRKFVSIKLDLKRTTFDPSVPLFPVTTYVTPVFEGGSQGTPIRFTQFIQKPNLSTLENHTTVTMPDKSSAVMYLGKQMVTHDRKEPRTMVDDIPYINRLFKKPDVREMEHVIVIATTTIVEVPAIDEYIEDYRTAVAEGRLEDAKRLAIKAIETDPKCFAK